MSNDKNIVPGKRPQMTKDEVLLLIKDFDVKGSEVIFVGIRGYYKNTMGNPLVNDVGIYDDAMFLITPTIFKAFNANTDPTVLHEHVAVLKPGLNWYRKGDHHIGKPNAYAAFRPANKEEKVPVTRDGKDDWGIAINIHQGGYNKTSSEGCQTIYPDQWKEFQTTAYEEMYKYHQMDVPYILLIG